MTLTSSETQPSQTAEGAAPQAAPTALVLGSFPPVPGPVSQASVAAVARDLQRGMAVQSVSLSGHGDAHATVDFGKAHALAAFRRALTIGPRPAHLTMVPGAIVLRRPDRLGRAAVLLQQIWTLLWVVLRAEAVTIEPGRIAGWWPAAALTGALLRLTARACRASEARGRRQGAGRSSDPLGEAALLLAAAQAEQAPDRAEAAAVVHALLLEEESGVTAACRTLTRRASPGIRAQPNHRALNRALRPDLSWSAPNAPVAAWMVHLRALTGALPGLRKGQARAAASLRRWADGQIRTEASFAGMAATLRAAGSLSGGLHSAEGPSQHPAESTVGGPGQPPVRRAPLSLALTSAGATPLQESAARAAAGALAAEQAWLTLRPLDALRRPLRVPTSELDRTLRARCAALLVAAAEADADTEARAEGGTDVVADGGRKPKGQTAAKPPQTALAPEIAQLVIALATGLPGGAPLPGRAMPRPLQTLIEGLIRRGAVPANLLDHQPASLRDIAAPDLGSGPASGPGIVLVGHGDVTMGLGANLQMTAETLRALSLPAILRNADDGLASIEPVGQGLCTEPVTPVARPASILHVNADRVPQTLLHRRLLDLGPQMAAIGFLLWEFDELPETHHLGVAMLDEIWAPTAFVADAYRPRAAREGTSVHVVGKALRDGPVAVLDRAALGLPETPFLFLTSFDFHSSVERKNPLALARAFLDAFPRQGAARRDDVGLVIKTTGAVPGHWGDPHRQWDAIRALAAADPRIIILEERCPAPVYRALLAAVDCVVSPHRAEGFGYLPAEAMLRGKPVIVTDHSGTRDFCTPRTAFPVPARLVRVAPGESIHPLHNAHWAEIDHDALVATLRQVEADGTERERRAAAGKAHIRREFGPDAHASRIATRLKDLGVLSAEPAPDATAPSGRQEPDTATPTQGLEHEQERQRA